MLKIRLSLYVSLLILSCLIGCEVRVKPLVRRNRGFNSHVKLCMTETEGNSCLAMTEVAKAQADSVVSSVESLLAEAVRMQSQCKQQSTELASSAVELHRESQTLREQCETTQLDMARLRHTLDQLLDTKHAFEARERQARKLSKQL